MIAETIAHLEANKASLGIKLVGGAAEFQTLVESNAAPTTQPAVFVMVAQEAGGENTLGNAVEQEIKAGIVIVSVLKNVADAKGAAAMLDMIELRKRERALLLGWPPAAQYAPLEFDRGAMTAFKHSHLYWSDVYRTVYYERAI